MHSTVENPIDASPVNIRSKLSDTPETCHWIVLHLFLAEDRKQESPYIYRPHVMRVIDVPFAEF